MPNIPDKALDLIKLFEGLRLNRYTDTTGHATIGYGHLCAKNDGLELITDAEALDLLYEDAGIAMATIRHLTDVPLNDNQLSALIDFVYNLGSGTYERSTLRMKINHEHYSDASEEFMKYVYAGPHVSLGLARRRMAEMELWNEKD